MSRICVDVLNNISACQGFSSLSELVGGRNMWKQTSILGQILCDKLRYYLIRSQAFWSWRGHVLNAFLIYQRHFTWIQEKPVKVKIGYPWWWVLCRNTDRVCPKDGGKNRLLTLSKPKHDGVISYCKIRFSQRYLRVCIDRVLLSKMKSSSPYHVE